MSSTRDCPQCGREAGFHTLACAAKRVTPPVDAGLARIQDAARALYDAVLVWASEHRSSSWVTQLVDDMGRMVGTVRYVVGDLERQRLDDEQKASNA